ncbi:MAG TPA: hypothetical protein VGO03_07075 [Acidimicrobiia bacterium]|jgi:hypothetical protein
MADEYDTLILQAYCGELLGDALFGAFASQLEGQRREKVELLQQIEQRTAAMLEPLVDPALLASVDQDAERAKGSALLAGGALDWDTFVKSLHDALPGFLTDFVRARELATDPEHPALAALVAHEQTIAAFTDLELSGHGDVTQAMLERYLVSAPWPPFRTQGPS